MTAPADPDKPGQEKRVEPGELVSDLPASAVPWLLDDGAIEPADSAAPKSAAPIARKPMPADEPAKKE